MKDFLKFIKEAAGVPENLVQTANLVYNRIVDEFETIVSLYGSIGMTCETLNNYIIRYKEKFKIGNKTFPEIEIKFKIKFDKNVEKIEIEELQHVYGVKYGHIKDKGYKMKKFGGPGGAVVIITFLMPEKTEIVDLKEFITKEKTEMVSAVSHELKHYFDLLVQPEMSPGKSLDYSAYLKFVSDIYPIYDFIFKLYYFHDVENSVRPSELLGLLDSEGITKSNFKQFFYKTEIWQQIEVAKKMTYEGIKEELEEYSDEMDEVLVELGAMDKYIDLINKKIHLDPLETKIEIFLSATYQSLKKLKIEALKGIIGMEATHPLRFRETSREKFMAAYLYDLQRHKNYEDFFRYEIKKINNEAVKLFKKVAGVYSLTPNDAKIEQTGETILKECVMDLNEWSKYFKIF